MSNEQEIAAIEKMLARSGLLGEYYNKSVARALVNAGYRKADEVHKETAKEIWNNFKLQRNHFDDWEWEVVKLICRTNGVEVDE